MLGLGYYLQNRIQNLEEKWPAHRTITIRGTISQMFLMYFCQMLTERHDLSCILNRGSKRSDWRPHNSIICSADRNITIRGTISQMFLMYLRQMLTERHDLRCVLNRGSKRSDWRPHKSIICSADRNITIRGQLTMLIYIFIKC